MELSSSLEALIRFYVFEFIGCGEDNEASISNGGTSIWERGTNWMFSIGIQKWFIIGDVNLLPYQRRALHTNNLTRLFLFGIKFNCYWHGGLLAMYNWLKLGFASNQLMNHVNRKYKSKMCFIVLAYQGEITHPLRSKNLKGWLVISKKGGLVADLCI